LSGEAPAVPITSPDGKLGSFEGEAGSAYRKDAIYRKPL
jgi:hypothetical protein